MQINHTTDKVIEVEPINTRVALNSINRVMQNQLDIIDQIQDQISIKQDGYPVCASRAIEDLERLIEAFNKGNFVITVTSLDFHK